MDISTENRYNVPDGFLHVLDISFVSGGGVM